MKKFKVLVRGENFLMNVDSVEIDSFAVFPVPGEGFTFYPEKKEA